MAKRTIIKQPIIKDHTKKSLIEAMLYSGEIIDTFKQPDHIKDLVYNLFLESGEVFRPNGRVRSFIEKIGLKTQEEADNEVLDCSFLSIGEDLDESSFIGLPPQFLKRDSRIHKTLLKRLNELERKAD